MSFYEHMDNRFILLIAQFKASILSGNKIPDIIKDFSIRFDEFGFLKELSYKLNQGKTLSEILKEQKGFEFSQKVKTLMDALDAGEFSVQKLDELHSSILKEKKENFESVTSSAAGRIGWLAFAGLVPVGIYFLATMAEIFQSVDMGSLVVTGTMKIITIMICGIIFAVILISKRLKNG